MNLKLLIFFLLSIFSTQFASGQCDANFNISGNKCYGDTLYFNFTGTGDSLFWNFGDVNSGALDYSNDSITKHNFTQSGTFIVRLIVKDSSNCSDTFIKKIYIYAKPIINFTFKNVCAGLNTLFTNTTTNDTGDVTNFTKWQFGDSSTSNVNNPSHLYNYLGTKSVKLTITTTQGCNDSITKTISIYSKPQLTKSYDSICQNTDINFNVNTGGNATSSTIWNLGDGTTQTNTNFNHRYNSPGFKKVKLTINYTNGGSCEYNKDSVWVFSIPNAHFSILTKRLQCYKGNETCISISLDSTGIIKRTVFWDDGSANIINANSSTACYQYMNPSGGVYKITQDVTDKNGCNYRYTIKDSVKIPKDPEAKFIFTKTGGCFKSFVNVQNTSNMLPPLVKKFEWNWDDNSLDSNTWTNNSHTYLQNGNFRIKLTIIDTFGCYDTVYSSGNINNISYDVDAKLFKVIDSCRTSNLFEFKQTPIAGGIITWFPGDGDSIKSWNPKYHYYKGVIMGLYKPIVRISKNGCDSTTRLDTAIVYGPFANLQAVNQFQCQIKDTVYFSNITSTFRNKNLKVLWNAADIYGQNCTIDSRNNIFKDSNCNASVDSLAYKHMFRAGKENCYTTSIFIEDTILGCNDTRTIVLPLMPPDASKGIKFNYNTNLCLGPELYKRVELNFDKTEPICDRESFWVMWDSTCARQTANFEANWEFNNRFHNYNYLPCNPDGSVTAGLIIQNGKDSLGNFCRDTFFYHKILNFGLIDPRFSSSYDSTVLYCKGSSFSFTMRDTMLDSLTQVIWNFGDGTIDTSLNLGNKVHKYKNNGIYRVTLFMKHKNGCIAFDSMRVKVGADRKIITNKTKICVGDTATLSNATRYYGGSNFWILPQRQIIEKTRWDIGDGNGFSINGPIAKATYSNINNYTIKMEYTDSVGCVDTFTFAQKIRAFDVFSSINIPKKVYTCAQVIQLFSSASVYDSLNNFGHLDDSVVKFSWYFDLATSNSILKNPFKFFKAGKHDVKLIAQNTIGCKDSFVDSFSVIGPTAKFAIITDTVGCQPFAVTFKNVSSNANSYTWKYNNPQNSITNTNSYANQNFTYTSYGIFYPQIIARNTFVNNGINVTCADTFSINKIGYRPKVDVKEKPRPNFSHVTNCALNKTTFNNTTAFTTGTVAKFEWFFGDGDTSQTKSPVHIYADTGKYRIVLKSYSSFGCVDSVVRIIYISPFPAADFNFTEVCTSNPTNFFDVSKSYNDIITGRTWNFGNGTTSGVKNPALTYAKDTFYNVRLTVTNRAGCSNFIIKKVNVWSRPKPNFTSNNVCLKTISQFTNTTASKQNPYNLLWNMGNGTIDSITNPKLVYNDTGKYKIKLIATTLYGCKDSITKTIQIYVNPKANFTISTNSQCQNQNLFNFTNTSTISPGSFVSHKWKTNDGGADTLLNFKRRFATADSFSVQLISKSKSGCSDTVSKIVKIKSSPKSTININNYEHCINGDSLLFKDNSPSDSLIVSRLWTLRPGVTRSQKQFYYKYNQVNTFPVSLVVTNVEGCKDTAKSSIIVRPKPTALIANYPFQKCFANHSFYIKDSSKIVGNTALSSKWNLGNGDSSINKSFNYTYQTADTFKVRLISKSIYGCLDTTSKQIIVHPMPVAAFSISKDSQCRVDNLFSFTNNSTVKGTNFSSVWNFGDGGLSILKDPSKTYLTRNTYTVKLKVKSTFGCLDSINKNVVVHPMPVANFIFEKQALCLLGNKITVINKSSIPYTTYKTQWLSHNSIQNGGDTFRISYPKDSIYNIKLIATSQYNCKDSITKAATIWPMPVANFIVDTLNKCYRNNEFSFTTKSTSKDNPLAHTWTFGDNDSSKLLNPKHSYLTDGIYNIQLITSSIHLCKDTAKIIVNVYPMPKAKQWINNADQCFNKQNYLIKDSSTIKYGITKAQWHWSDNSFDTLKSLSRVFEKDTTLWHQLVSTSNYNCADTVVFKTILHPTPLPNTFVLDSTQCLNTQNFYFFNQSKIKSGTMSYVWKFGDGQTANTDESLHKYATEGIYNVNLLAVSNFGCKDSVFYPIRVYAKPNVQVNLTDKQCFLNHDFILNGTSTINQGTIDKYIWIKDEAVYSKKKDTSIIYQTHGSYVLMYVLESNFGCRDTLNQTLVVHPMPVSSFVINKPIQCENNNNYLFNATSTIPYSKIFYNWNIDNSSFDTAKNIQRKYILTDTMNVRLITTSEFLCKDTANQTIYIQPQPFVKFAINDTNQCMRFNRFDFKNNTTLRHGIMTFDWNLGDSTYSTQTNTTHTYSKHKDYFVELKALSNYGCRDSQTIKVIVYPDPTAAFSINDPGQCVRYNNFVFSNLSIIDSSKLNYNWRFGDNLFSNIKNTTHRYAMDGKYVVDLIVKSAYNCQDSIKKTIFVNPMPVSRFSVNDTDQCINEQLFTFTNKSTIKYGGIDSLKWHVNNQVFNQQTTLNTRYSTSGLKTTYLRTVSDSLCVDTFTKVLRVYPKPKADFVINDSVQCLTGNKFVFTSTSTDSFGIKTQEWRIDNLFESSAANFTKTFVGPRKYSIQIVPTSVYNCKDTFATQVRVKPMPDPKFNELKAYYCNHEPPFLLIPFTPGGLFTGKNVIGNQLFPINLWKDTVNYTVTVDGCTTSSFQQTEIYPHPEIELGRDTLLCKSEAVLLKATNWNSKYMWQDGRTDAEYLAFKPGLYFVTATNICGSATDSITVQFRPLNCRLFIPTAFSPNNDPFNNLYKPVGFGLLTMNYEIFNRWGEKIFVGDIDSPGWDGTYQGLMAQDAYFLVMVNYTYHTGFKKVAEYEKEVFYLLR